jgi:hypothetical protein
MPPARRSTAARTRGTPTRTATTGTHRRRETSSRSAPAPRVARAAATQRRLFDEASERIAALRRRGTESFDELWEEIAEVVEGDTPLWRAAYPTLEAYIRAELPGETRRSVARNVLVARSFSPADEARHGNSFLEEVALYARELAGAAETPRAIDLDRLRIPVPVQGGMRRVAAREASIEDVRRARRALARQQGRAGRRKATPAEQALRAALTRRAPLRAVEVRATPTHANFAGVPLDALGVFADTVKAVRIEGGDVA